LLGTRAAGDAAGAARRVIDQVFLGHRATAAGARHLRRVDAFLLGGEARARGQVGVAAGRLRRGRGGRGGGLLLLRRRGLGLGRLGRFFLLRRRGAFLDRRQ